MKPFPLNHCRSWGNQACLLCTLCKSLRANAFRASCQVSENSELFKKPEPGAQFQWERTSSADQLSCSIRGSKAEPTTNPLYSSLRGQEMSLDQGRFQRALRHSMTNGGSPLGLRQPSALGFNLRQGKATLTLRLHTLSIVNDRSR